MNPLHILKDWTETLPKDIRVHLIALAAHFHPDQSIDSVRDSEERERFFLEYLNANGLTKRECVYRTFVISKLIDFAFSNGRSEADWDTHLDLLLDIRSMSKEENQPTDIEDKALSSFHDRKEKNLAAYESWESLKSDALDERKIADWYFLLD